MQNDTFYTSDEVKFMRGLSQRNLKLYWRSLKHRKFPETINKRVIINQTLKRIKELKGAI